MIELLSADTPNGKKISIMLEEIGFEYSVTKININKDEQFNPEFRNISPLAKFQLLKMVTFQYLNQERYLFTWVKKVESFTI